MDFEGFATVARTYGLVYLGVIFAGILAYALWPRNRTKFDDAARIPLKED